MKPVIYLLLLLLITASGCKQVLLLRYGIHQPREETPESILRFMEKRDYPNENTFLFRDSSSFFACMRDSVFRSNVLGTLFFSPQGLLDDYKDTARCQWSGGYFVQNLKPDTLYHADTSYTLQKLMTFTRPLNERTRIDTAGADFVVFVTWASFLGSYNDRLFAIRESIRENTEVRVKPVFLCIDLQKSWNPSAREKEILRFD